MASSGEQVTSSKAKLGTTVTKKRSLSSTSVQRAGSLSRSKTMTTVVQQPSSATFGPSNDNSSYLGVSVSKMKQKSPTTLSANLTFNSSQLSKQIAASTNVPSTETNGSVSSHNSTSPRPHTTSQKPKIKLLERSVAVNSAPHDLNQPDECNSVSLDKPQHSPNSTSNSISPTTSASNATEQASPATVVLSSKLNSRSTPTKQNSSEYASSPSSTSSSLNRENSLDYKDSSGIDLHEFMVKTLKENPRDRLMLLKLEKDFTEFIQDTGRVYQRYPPMTSYHRMLVHRVAAYFGLDHNVDSSGKSVIVNKTTSTRIPETRFQSYCSREYTDEELSSEAVPKSILLRSNTASSEEASSSPRLGSPLPDRHSLEDKRSKSFEEREEDYIKAKERIFKDSSLDLELSSNPSISPLSTPDGSIRQRTYHSQATTPIVQTTESQSEKEAAIAAVAAATGKKGTPSNVTVVTKRAERNERSEKYSKGASSTNNYGNSNQQYPYGGYTWPGGVDPVTASQVAAAANDPYGTASSPYQANAANMQGSGAAIPAGINASGVSAVDGSLGQHGAILINPQTGYPMTGADGNPIYYSPAAYQQMAAAAAAASGQVSYPPMQGLALYAHQQQQQQAQQQAQQQQQQAQQQQQQAHPYGAVYYMGGPPGTAQAHHYYVMQQVQGGQPVYQQGQAPSEPQSPSAVLLSPRQVAYPDINSQMAGMTIAAQRRVSVDEQQDPSVHEKLSGSTPSSPVDAMPPQIVYHQGRQCIVIPPGRLIQGQTGVYAAGAQSGVPVQFVQGGQAYMGQYPQYMPTEAERSYPQQHSQTPSPPQPQQQPPRAPSPAMVARTPPAGQQVQQKQQASAQVHSYPATATSPGQGGPRFVSGILPMNQMYMPMGTMPLMTGQYTANPHGMTSATTGVRYQTHNIYRPGDKHNIKSPESPSESAFQYQGLLSHDGAQRPRGMVTMNQQQRPLLTMVPLNPGYSYMGMQPRFFPGHHMYNQQYIQRAMQQSSHRKMRPRHTSPQIRISRRNSNNNNEMEQKTVSHILEIFDFPDTVTSNDDAVFDDIKNTGARILKINSSSTTQQSASSTHNLSTPTSASSSSNGASTTSSSSSSTLGPTILAIFKSASDAQRALETISSPHYKLRVSQKSQTHFSGDSSNVNSSTAGKTG